MRTRKTSPPSQNPKQRLSNPGPFKSTQTSTFVYGFAYWPLAWKVSSTFSQTCTSFAATIMVGKVIAATNTISGFMNNIL
jgi:hypothetical protein